jgi:hypothetical protein
MENMPRPYPFRLVGVGSAYQDIVHHLFIDYTERDHINNLYRIDLPKAVQAAPMVNMVAIRQIPDDSINDILEESPNIYSEGSTEIVSSCPTFLPGLTARFFISATTASPEMAKPPMSAMLTWRRTLIANVVRTKRPLAQPEAIQTAHQPGG